MHHWGRGLRITAFTVYLTAMVRLNGIMLRLLPQNHSLVPRMARGNASLQELTDFELKRRPLDWLIFAIVTGVALTLLDWLLPGELPI